MYNQIIFRVNILPNYDPKEELALALLP